MNGVLGVNGVGEPTGRGVPDAALATLERQIVNRVEARFAELRNSNAEYFAYLEDVSPDLARRAELVDLMNSAPTLEVLMFLYAKFTMRLQLAAITGREFD